MYCENSPFLYFFTSSSNLRLFNFKNIVQKSKQALNKLSSELRAVTLSNIMTNSEQKFKSVFALSITQLLNFVIARRLTPAQVLLNLTVR